MKHPKRVLLLTLLSCSISAIMTPLTHAASSATLELEIKAKQCTLDATTAGVQQSLTISPTDCSQEVSQLLTSQNAADAASISYQGKRFGVHSPSTRDKRSSFSYATVTSPHPPQTANPQAGNQIPITVGLSLILALSADILVFNMYLTQTTLRQFAKVVRFIKPKN